MTFGAISASPWMQAKTEDAADGPRLTAVMKAPQGRLDDDDDVAMGETAMAAGWRLTLTTLASTTGDVSKIGLTESGGEKYTGTATAAAGGWAGWVRPPLDHCTPEAGAGASHH